MDIEFDGKELGFRVQNPILEKGKPLQKHSGIGLDNVGKRLRLLYPGRHTLDISDNDRIFDVRMTIRLKE